jgi:hypothetical protein
MKIASSRRTVALAPIFQLLSLCALIVGSAADDPPKDDAPMPPELPEPVESHSSAALRLNRSVQLPLDRWFPSADVGAASLDFIRQRVNLSYLQCLYHSGRTLRVHRSTNKPKAIDADFIDFQGRSTSSSAFSTMATAARWSANPCGFQFISDADLFSGVDSLILIGDSTILRDYQHILHASDLDYFGKVIKVEKGYLNSTSLTLSSGRVLPVHFFRLLYTSVVDSILDNVFSVATRNSLIIVSVGPHDTSWLVFNKAMPGFPPKKLHNWAAAQAYYERNAEHMVNQFARKLRAFEERNGGAGEVKDAPLFRRPVVVFRDMFVPNCQASKFVRRPEVKCEKLLVGTVVPFYRRYLRAHLAAVNIPTVTMDQVMPPCYLMDAGHLVRKCKRIELQLFAQAFRMTRTYNILQGFPLSDPVLYRRGKFRTRELMERPGVGWKVMNRMVEFVQPHGYIQDDWRLDTDEWRHLRSSKPPMLSPPEAAQHWDMRRIMGVFYNASLIEKEPGMDDTTPFSALYFVPRTITDIQDDESNFGTPYVGAVTLQKDEGEKGRAEMHSSHVSSAGLSQDDDWHDDVMPPQTARGSWTSSRVHFGQLPWLLFFAAFAAVGYLQVR